MPPNVRADHRAADDDDFAAALAAAEVANSPAFVTAVSGGPDSTALALLAQRFATRHKRRHLALIVDHGLRDGSADEARQVQARLADFGVASRIQPIMARPPTASIQEWARRHRHDLLAAAARAAGAVVLFGHHADDQAETVAMRLQNQSGLAGIGGMPLRRWHHDVLFARPLLGWRRSDLIAVCAAHGCAYET
ncbi:MAG: tRNA lysidine(34) synthetase TilS, partial [Candidatus Puniceispirillum sp.]